MINWMHFGEFSYITYTRKVYKQYLALPLLWICDWDAFLTDNMRGHIILTINHKPLLVPEPCGSNNLSGLKKICPKYVLQYILHYLSSFTDMWLLPYTVPYVNYMYLKNILLCVCFQYDQCRSHTIYCRIDSEHLQQAAASVYAPTSATNHDRWMEDAAREQMPDRAEEAQQCCGAATPQAGVGSGEQHLSLIASIIGGIPRGASRQRRYKNIPRSRVSCGARAIDVPPCGRS